MTPGTRRLIAYGSKNISSLRGQFCNTRNSSIDVQVA
jgi:hypothetical protein